MTQNQLYELAYHSILICLHEKRRDLGTQDFRDAWKRLLHHYALQNGTITAPKSAEEVIRNHHFVLEHYGEIEPMFNQRDLYNLIVAAEHVGRQDDSARFRAILKQKEPSLDVETSVRVWKSMVYDRIKGNETLRENSLYPIAAQFLNAFVKAKGHDYDGAIAELDSVRNDNPNVMAEKEFFLGTIYLIKWQTSGFSDVTAMARAREHLENQVKYRGGYLKEGLEELALISSFEGGFRGPLLEGRTLKAFKHNIGYKN